MFDADLLVAHTGDEGGVSLLAAEDGRVLDWLDLPHAVFLLAAAAGDLVYALHGTAREGFVSVISVVAGRLALLDTVETGAEPCHAALVGRRQLAVACYSAACVELIDFDEGGALTGVAQKVELHGTGPDFERQRSAHPHFVAEEENGAVLVVDLGSDALWHIDRPASAPRVSLLARSVAGAGPRHALDLDDVRVVTDELSGHLSTFAREDSRLRGRVPVSSLDTGAPSYPSDLALIAGTRLVVVGVRGRGAVAIARIDAEGIPELCAEVSIPGSWVQQVLSRPDGVLAVDRDGGRLLSLAVDPAAVEAVRWREVRSGLRAPMWVLALPGGVR